MRPDEVTDFESFLGFVNWLAADRAEEAEKERQAPTSPWGRGHNGWQNTTIDAFLEAAAACAKGHLHKRGEPPAPTWREFARFLIGGKFYE